MLRAGGGMRWVIAPDRARALLLDGLEGTPTAVAFGCGACGAAVWGDLWDLLGRSTPAHALTRAERDAWDLESVSVLDWEVGRTGGLTAYLAEARCGCGALHDVVLGLSEVQPARYQARLHAVALR